VKAFYFGVPTPCPKAEGNTGGCRYRETPFGLRAVLEPEHARKLFTRNPGDPAFGLEVMASRSAV